MWWAWPSLAFLPCTITTPRCPKPFRRPRASAAVGGQHSAHSKLKLYKVGLMLCWYTPWVGHITI